MTAAQLTLDLREQGRLCAKKIASQTETTTKGKPQ